MDPETPPNSPFALPGDMDALRLIADAVPLLISYVDSDLRFRFANRAYTDWFGLKQDQVVGSSVEEVLGARAAAQIRPYLDMVLRDGEPVTYETEMAYAHGGRRFVHTHLNPDRAPEGSIRGFVAVIADITLRRRAEQARERREREFAALVENSPDIICRFDRAFRCLYTNPAASRLLGQPQEFFIGKTHAQMGMPPETCQTTEDGLKEIFETGQPGSVEFQVPENENDFLYFEATGVPLFAADGRTVDSVMTVARNVTQRRRIEHQNATLLRAQAEAGLLQRALLRDVLYSVSEGRFVLCHYEDDLPSRFAATREADLSLSAPALSRLRRIVASVADNAGFAEERMHDLISASGEAAMNAVVHAGGGEASVYAAKDGSAVQVWIEDRGRGIAETDLHKTFRRGYSSAGTLGHGFWMMLRLADRVYLRTGASGTTVVIEQQRVAPDPLWMQER